jgi:hypothetical protein
MRSFLVDQFTYLSEVGVLSDNENAIKRFKEALAKANALFDEQPALKDTRNRGLLAALLYNVLKGERAAASFVRWVVENHLHHIADSSASDLTQIFDQVLESRKRTIFVSMPFGKGTTENHYKIIERVCDEVSKAYTLKPPLKVERVDWFHDGTSYEITDKIVQMISDCGLLIGDLTYGNANVYHEIGFVMGKSKGEGKDGANILLFLDEGGSAKKDSDKTVAFSVRGIKQLRFTETEEFAKDLRKNVELFFKL